MKYIKDLHEGETIRSIYLCKGKRSAETRNGKPYDNLLLQDKTGTLDGKIWDPNSQGIADYDEKDFIEMCIRDRYWLFPISAGSKSSIIAGAVAVPRFEEVISVPSSSTNQSVASR